MENNKGNEHAEQAAFGMTLPIVLTVAELARVMRLDRKTVYELIAAGTLPGVRRCGRSLRIHRNTVLRWLAHGQGPAPHPNEVCPFVTTARARKSSS